MSFIYGNAPPDFVFQIPCADRRELQHHIRLPKPVSGVYRAKL
jgi:hypothetical protein